MGRLLDELGTQGEAMTAVEMDEFAGAMRLRLGAVYDRYCGGH